MWWPDKFKPAAPPRYNGTTDPLAFLLVYEEAILEAGGDDSVMAKWLPMALTGAPRAWLLHLPAASVASWEELRSLFPAHHATPTPPFIAALLGGLQAPPTSHHVKPFIRRVSRFHAAGGSPGPGGARDRPDIQLGGPPLQLGLLGCAPHAVHPHHLPGGRH